MSRRVNQARLIEQQSLAYRNKGKMKRLRIERNANPTLRVRWLSWLAEEYGPDIMAEWQEPPISFEEWSQRHAA